MKAFKLTSVLVVAMSLGGGVLADTDLRATLINVGTTLNKTAQDAAASSVKDPRFHPAKPVIDGKEVTVCGVVKMWAVLADKTGKEISGPVNMKLHKWQAEEYFYLYFESATPILVSLHQLYPETGHPMAGETRLVLPDKEFPKSLEAIPAGTAVRMPILMQMDRTLVDEAMGVSIQCLNIGNAAPTGNATLDAPPIVTAAQAPQASEVDGGGATIATRQINYANTAARLGFVGKQYSIPERARFSAVSEVATPAGPNPSIDDVAIILACGSHINFVKITLHKD